MKEIKKEIKHETVEVQTQYEATDGTLFSDEKECRKYEESAAGVLMARVAEFSSCVENEFDENDENEYKFVLPKSPEQLDIINQLYKMHAGSCKEGCDEVFLNYEDIGEPILMGYRFYESGNEKHLDWVWFYKMESIIKKLTGSTFVLTPNTIP